MSQVESEPIAAADLDREGWRALNDVVAAFERDWQSNCGADPEQYLMSGPETLRLRTLIELLKVELEFRWERGERRRIDESWGRLPALGETAAIRRELVEAECITRCGLGDAVRRDELEARFGKLARDIDLPAIRRQVAREGWSAAAAETIVPADGTPGGPHLVDAPRLSPGTNVGKFVIRGELGHGGMGLSTAPTTRRLTARSL